ncbi:sensor histidine kinase [Paenibacillus donghaensis]|uniref:histidine kinase n=1 Tax=Paenibacillus donghaensis TaxID=414771 RepID=A0A2Z2KEP5_9BACL|nr:HAMP domain-containing sensor histidine kinase [Paenibacillus donghaensis]ASA24564.1 two-component sensor histidine kinase [Paenibacillus donghaensis]
MSLFKKIVRQLLFHLAFFSAVAVSWTAAYYLMNLVVYSRFGRPHYAYVDQLIVTLIGIVFLLLLGMALSSLIRGWERVFYRSVIEAIGRIAKGDFNVVLERNKNYGDFGEIVESINDMASELGRMETMRQDFISNVSHEIQSPLTSIRGFTRALQRETLDAESRKHYLEIIEAESTRLSGLSDNLLKLSVLEAGSFPFERKSYPLDKQLREIIVVAEPQWLEKQIEVEAELDEVTIHASQDLLSQIWTNLLHNSIKFTPPGGRIHISLRQTASRVEVEVRDSGIGIAAEDLSHIFERFYKADKARSASGGGSGLGLSLVRKIAEVHQGTATAASVPGEGTSIVVSLPNLP